MAIYIVSFPMKNGGSFHSYVTNYQRVHPPWLSGATFRALQEGASYGIMAEGAEVAWGFPMLHTSVHCTWSFLTREHGQKTLEMIGVSRYHGCFKLYP